MWRPRRRSYRSGLVTFESGHLGSLVGVGIEIRNFDSSQAQPSARIPTEPCPCTGCLSTMPPLGARSDRVLKHPTHGALHAHASRLYTDRLVACCFTFEATARNRFFLDKPNPPVSTLYTREPQASKRSHHETFPTGPSQRRHTGAEPPKSPFHPRTAQPVGARRGYAR